MLLIAEKGIRGGICRSFYRYAKANNKHIKDYDKIKKSPCLHYWDVNNLYHWGMSTKFPVNKFDWIKGASQFNEEDFVKNYNEESDEGYFLEFDFQYLEKLHELPNDLQFLPERMKITKVEKLVANLHVKFEYVIHIRNLKQVSLNHGLFFTKVHRVIKFNQNTWLKTYIDMNIDLRKKAKNEFEKDFFKLMNNAVFGKTMENVKKHRDIKLLKTERRRNYLESEPNYHTTKSFTEILLAIEIKKLK